MNIEIINLDRFKDFIKSNADIKDIQSYMNDLILWAYKGGRSYRLKGQSISFNYKFNYDEDTDEDNIIIEF